MIKMEEGINSHTSDTENVKYMDCIKIEKANIKTECDNQGVDFGRMHVVSNNINCDDIHDNIDQKPEIYTDVDTVKQEHNSHVLETAASEIRITEVRSIIEEHSDSQEPMIKPRTQGVTDIRMTEHLRLERDLIG